MCGILCELLYSGPSILKADKVISRIKNRGPDCTKSIEINIGNGGKLLFCGSVLWMQGPRITPQPIENNYGILLHNGDIFNKSWDKGSNDSLLLMERLSNLKGASTEKDIIEELKLLNGPFSIIYYDKVSHQLYFARDRIGRNSLLFYRSKSSLVISSVLGREYKCIEVPATHIHIFHIKSNRIQLHSWVGGRESHVCDVEDWMETVQKQQSISDEEFTFDFEDTLNLNVEDDVVRYIQNASQETKCKTTLMKKIMTHAIIKETVTKITELLEQSIKLRLEAQPNRCKKCLFDETVNCSHCTVGILYSGGLDCTILAFLANKYLPEEQSIELLNVAFKRGKSVSYEVPDRLTGSQSLEELKKLCQNRKWMFKEINVAEEELERVQISNIADLVYPRQTILDESLGSALWFAAHGQDENSTSSCRVLLLGSGADELFGGYTRHRNAFKRKGWSGLEKELQLDWKRISFRNLARDNRVICDHGRQPRMPYLDEDLTDFVLKLKPWLKSFPTDSLGHGVGDKLILRLVAYNLGLKEVAIFPKRAMQFGSRIANKKEKGSDMSKTFIDMKIND